MRSLSGSKKGSARVYLGIVVFLFIFGFINILAYTLLDEFVDAFTTAGVYGVEAQRAVEPMIAALRVLDYVIVFMLIVFAVGIALTSYRVAVSPAFYAIQFLAVVFYGFISFFFNYIFQQLVSPSVFNVAKAAYSNTIIVCTNLHWVLLAHFIIGAITFFAKKEKGQFVE